jgi:hypothetical protein
LIYCFFLLEVNLGVFKGFKGKALGERKVPGLGFWLCYVRLGWVRLVKSLIQIRSKLVVAEHFRS